MENESYIKALEMQVQKEKLRNQQLETTHAATMFNSEENENIVKYQLDIQAELKRIERLLRKHIPRVDQKTGNEYFEVPSEEDQLLNEKGVNEILNFLSWYMHKGIILSNFSQEDINTTMKQISMDLVDFIFNTCEDLGLYTEERQKHYPKIVMNIINVIHAAYLRALNGGERESLRKNMIVNGTIDQNQNQNLQALQKQSKWYNPFTWGGG